MDPNKGCEVRREKRKVGTNTMRSQHGVYIYPDKKLIQYLYTKTGHCLTPFLPPSPVVGVDAHGRRVAAANLGRIRLESIVALHAGSKPPSVKGAEVARGTHEWKSTAGLLWWTVTARLANPGVHCAHFAPSPILSNVTWDAYFGNMVGALVGLFQAARWRVRALDMSNGGR